MTPSLTYRLLERHLVAGSLRPGDDITVRVDHILLEDATATMAAMQFEQLGAEVAVPLAVVYIDHNVIQIDDKNMQDHRYLRSFARRFGLVYSPAGHGISHYIHLERFGQPGRLLVGADSHSSMAGALGMFAVGAGGLEVAVAMAGYGFEFACPRVIGVELVGELGEGVQAKDVVLELLRRYGVRGGRGAVFEFFGPGVAAFSVSARATICNMIVETGATTAVFPSDERTREWLVAQGRGEAYVPLSADPSADFDELLILDLREVSPLVAVPHSPGNVITAAEAAGTPVTQVCVGSSVNSSYEDLATVAGMLKGRTVAPGVALTVTPGSRQILDTIIESGVYQELIQAGARMLEPICGPCVGIGQAPLGGAASLRTFNRNFPGRSGTAEDQVYLCSPATAAASAIAGHIVDPREHEAPVLAPPPPPDLGIHHALMEMPLTPEERAEVEVDRGENLVPPPRPPRAPRDLTGRTLIVAPDDVSTGEMAPDGAIAMSVWSNIEACSRFMFRRLDPGFAQRAHDWGGGVIVAGDNYGQGSSREHAALIPLFLGVRAVVASSYARIHRRNLIAVGIVPLTRLSRDEIEVGEEWSIDGLAAAVQAGASRLPAMVGGRSVELGLDLSPAERAAINSGGMLSQIADGDRPRVQVLPR